MDQLPPHTIVGIILGLFTILGFLKSFVKSFFNLIALAVGAVVGLYAYNHGFRIAQEIVAEPAPWMSMAIGVTAFIFTVTFLRTILNFLAGKSRPGSQAHTGGFGLPGGTFGLIFGLGFAYFMLTGVRYAGTMAELERLKEYVTGKIEATSEEPIFSKLKLWLDQSQIGEWHQKIDFLNNPAEINAAKLAIVQSDPQKFSALYEFQDRELIPRALPVDPAVQEAYDKGNYAAILTNQEIHAKLREVFSEEQLRQIDVEQILGLRP